MLSTYEIALDGHDGLVHISTDQRDLFALRRRGWRELEYGSPEEAMAVFNRASGDGKLSDSAMATLGLEALTTVTWLLWNAAVRNEITSSDFDTFAEKELISMTPVESTNGNGNGDAARPTKKSTSVGGSAGSPR